MDAKKDLPLIALLLACPLFIAFLAGWIPLIWIFGSALVIILIWYVFISVIRPSRKERPALPSRHIPAVTLLAENGYRINHAVLRAYMQEKGKNKFFSVKEVLRGLKLQKDHPGKIYAMLNELKKKGFVQQQYTKFYLTRKTYPLPTRESPRVQGRSLKERLRSLKQARKTPPVIASSSARDDTPPSQAVSKPNAMAELLPVKEDIQKRAVDAKASPPDQNRAGVKRNQTSSKPRRGKPKHAKPKKVIHDRRVKPEEKERKVRKDINFRDRVLKTLHDCAIKGLQFMSFEDVMNAMQATHNQVSRLRKVLDRLVEQRIIGYDGDKKRFVIANNWI